MQEKRALGVDTIVQFWEGLSGKIKYTFIGTFLIGLAAHGFVFANKISNHDDLYSVRAYGATIAHGRWLQSFLGPLVSKFNGNFTNPWILGLASLLFLSIAACFVVEALEIQNIYSCILIGGIMVSFPTIIGNFTFMFIAPYFSFSILLIVIAAYLFIQNKGLIYTISAMICVACSMGIYQAYFPFLSGILLIALIKKAFCAEESVMEVCRTAVRYLIDLAMSMASYFVSLKMMLMIMHATLTDHLGINTMGKVKISAIPGIVVNMYRNTFSMIHSDYMGMSADLLIQLLVGCSFLATLTFAIVAGVRMISQKQWLKFILGVAFISIFPIAINLIDIMCASDPEGNIYSLMEYGLLLIFVLPIALWENASWIPFQWCVAIAGISVIIYYVNLANETYLYTYLSQTAVESFYTAMIAQIRSQDGYTSDKAIVFVGDVQDKAIYPLYEEFPNVHIPSVSGSAIKANLTADGFLKYYCGFYPEFSRECPAEYEDEVEKMPCYPDNGSIQIFGDQVIVKFSEK